VAACAQNCGGAQGGEGSRGGSFGEDVKLTENTISSARGMEMMVIVCSPSELWACSSALENSRSWSSNSDRYELRRGDHVLKIEKNSLEMTHSSRQDEGRLVARKKIVEKIWGKTFSSTLHGLNCNSKRIRQFWGMTPSSHALCKRLRARGTVLLRRPLRQSTAQRRQWDARGGNQFPRQLVLLRHGELRNWGGD